MTYKMILGDCMPALRSMPDNSFDAIITDAPYGDINDVERLHEREKYKGGGIRHLHKGAGDEVNFDWDELLTHLVRIARSWIYIFAGDHTGYARSFFNANDCMTRVGVWEKTNPSPLHGEYIWTSSIELFAIARKRQAKFNRFCASPVLRYPRGSSLRHPTEKPLGLMREIVESSTRPGDSVLDPFCGTGTTGEACCPDREFTGIELEKKYYKLSDRRLSAAWAAAPLFKLSDYYAPASRPPKDVKPELWDTAEVKNDSDQ